MQYDLIEHEANYSLAKFPEPRPFQDTAHDKLRQGAREGNRCQMIMSPTGSGKTYLAMRIIHEALKRGKRAMFVCDRTTLINQTSEVADSYGLGAHSVIQAGHWRYDLRQPFQIASIQTLARRAWPDSDVIVIDEAHSMYSAWTNYIDSCSANVIGLSATPFSKGLGRLFTNLINAATMNELTQSGVLVPMRVYSCTKIDMRGAETSGGEWKDSAAAERGMDIIGDVVTEWQKFAENRKTIVFGATINHCEELCRQFNESGIMAATFTSNTDDLERKSLLEEYSKQESVLRVLISVEALAKGFDVPDVGCICDCRPLRKSLSTAIQMWGRGLRSSPDTGKVDCVARDTLILTDKGEVKIQHVTLDHKVWDGLNFVDHCGAICRGVRPVIHYDGLTATHDHEVMTDDGWKRFEDAARWKQRIAVTGIGGTPIRFGKDSFSKDRGQRREAKGRGFMHSMRALLDGFCQQHLEQAGNSGLPKLQWSQAGKCSEMAISALSRMVSALHKSSISLLRTIRGAWDSVSFSWGERGCAVGIGHAWRSGSQHGDRQDRQRRALRTGESSLGFASCEHEQHQSFRGKEGVYCLSEKSPGSNVLGQHASPSYIENDGRRNSGEVEPAIVQAEREVWDILNAGPLQRFTAGGRLVHNCVLLDFSGNIIRFADDFSDIYYNGLDELDAGEKLDKAIRRDDEEKEPSKCPSCGFSPCGKRCLSCGHERQPNSLIEHLPGSMTEVMIGKQKLADDHKSLYEQVCTYTRAHGNPATSAARAWYLFQDFAKCKPHKDWKFEDQPNTVISRATMNHIKRKQIAYINGIKKGANK